MTMFKIPRFVNIAFFKNVLVCFLDVSKSLGVSEVKIIGFGAHGHFQKSQIMNIMTGRFPKVKSKSY